MPAMGTNVTLSLRERRRHPRHVFRSYGCLGILAAPTMFVMMSLLLFPGCPTAAKGLPKSAGGGGAPLSDHKRSQDGTRSRRDRLSPASTAAATPNERRRNKSSHAADITVASKHGRYRGVVSPADGDDGGGEGGDESDEGRYGYGNGYDGWSDDGSDGWSDEGDEDDEEDDEGGWVGGEGRGRRGRGTGQPMGGTSMRERLNSARRRASRAYREAKSLMSSEMEGVVLKATRPDDLPVKPKHLEALMRPTTEMPKEFNVYLPVVRKLWAKMADREWRVSAKALYIVHRFAADGSSEHAVNLKESVAVLRTHHDSRRKVNYFDMDTICDVKAPSWSGEDVTPFSDFLRAYADFVLQRTTQFGPGFAELLDNYAMMVGDGETLAAVGSLLSAGLKCFVTEEQESAVTVAATVQAVQDVRDVMEVCAAQLDFLAREGNAHRVYPAEVQSWYAFLYENHDTVKGLITRTNELAAKHKLTPLRPLAAVPLVLKLRDGEIAAEQKKASLEAELQHQQTCSATDKPEEALAEREKRAGVKDAKKGVDAEGGKRRDGRGHKVPTPSAPPQAAAGTSTAQPSAAASRTADGGSLRPTDVASRGDGTTRTRDIPQRGDTPTTAPTTTGKKRPGGGVSNKKQAGSKTRDAVRAAAGRSNTPEESVSTASATSTTRRPKTSRKVSPGSGGDGTGSAAEGKRTSGVKTATGYKEPGIKARCESSSNMKSDGAQPSSSSMKGGVSRAGTGARRAASTASAEGTTIGVGHSSKANKRGAGGPSSAASKTRKRTSAEAGKTPPVDRSRGPK